MAKSSASVGKQTAVENGLSPDLSYEQALAELETLVAKMEAGQLPLEQLLSSYQRGAQLLQFCRGRLEAVEAQVKLLDAGQLKPLDTP
ncbi:MAG: exodeoxyribonuclease VII small subunit [Burkholderiales bacterium]|nr:exodeoxyribonuclease VII small subunit [Burkholderiales bacterium]MDE2076680.1 exodeoxyribonuclease VII small subunit [Burkholderiales bacterium]MDE2431558.1 exodeoxyribonuclease VII small subunit [Burkholderiales bacterium]HET8693133.1 exodeoxyribonuclease VII small subunit [Aquabacterium sp.]